MEEGELPSQTWQLERMQGVGSLAMATVRSLEVQGLAGIVRKEGSSDCTKHLWYPCT
jgi:hypothetical protein